MSEGSPEEHAQAIDAEHQGVTPSYLGRRGKLDAHATAKNILAYDEIITNQPQADAMRRKGGKAIAAFERAEKLEAFFDRAILRVGDFFAVKDENGDVIPVYRVFPF